MNPRSFLPRTVCLVAVLTVVTGAEGSAPAPRSGVVEYEMQMTFRTQPVRKVQQKIWFKGERFRTESNTPLGKQILIGGPDGMFQIAPGSTEATKFPVPPRPAGAGPRPKSGVPGLPLADASMIRERWQKVGSEKVGRRMADIYEPRLPSRPGMPKDRRFTEKPLETR